MSMLEIKHLSTDFETENGLVHAVRDVSLSVDKGEVLGIVGESGSGKSQTMFSVMGLLTGNGIVKEGSIETQLIEPIMNHMNISKEEAKQRAIELMRKVGIPSPEARIRQYPHQFSGGMRQRIIIAIALACDPKIIIADEPTTALDVTIQAQVLELISQLKEEIDSGIIMITHDLGVVASICDRIAIMYGGKIVETGSVFDIFEHPQHPYTKGLLSCISNPNELEKKELHPIPGSPPDLLNIQDTCPFADRCASAMKICKLKMPEETAVSESHICSCWLQHPKAQKGGEVQ